MANFLCQKYLCKGKQKINKRYDIKHCFEVDQKGQQIRFSLI